MGEVFSGRRPFKFENVWLEVVGFCDLVNSCWNHLIVTGPSSFILAKKLSALKTNLKEWSRDVFGHLEFKMAKLMEKVKSLAEKVQQQTLSWDDRVERLEVKKELSLVRGSLDIYWRQRAKQHLLVDGDRNTKFFHQVANRRRKFNTIHKIKVDGECFVDAALVKNAIVQFYERLYHDDQPVRLFLGGIAFNAISLEDARDLVEDFTEDEVWKAITELGKEKAPGPDGFNVAFFQHCWSIVKEVLDFLLTFINMTFLRKVSMQLLLA